MREPPAPTAELTPIASIISIHVTWLLNCKITVYGDGGRNDDGTEDEQAVSGEVPRRLRPIAAAPGSPESEAAQADRTAPQVRRVGPRRIAGPRRHRNPDEDGEHAAVRRRECTRQDAATDRETG